MDNSGNAGGHAGSPSGSKESSLVDDSQNSLNKNIHSIISFLESPCDSSTADKDDTPQAQPVSILKGVTAYVEVRAEYENRSRAVERQLRHLGALISGKLTAEVTHVVFKGGRRATVKKAQKLGQHLVSVLWVESCKKNEEHMPENQFQAILPGNNNKGTPSLICGRVKKSKSMQPKDFDEVVANSGDRAMKKRKREANALKWKLFDVSSSSEETSPILLKPSIKKRFLVPETQPRTPEDISPGEHGIVVPDTPSSMKETLDRMQSFRKKIHDPSYSPHSSSDEDILDKLRAARLQRKLFDADADSAPGSPQGCTSIQTETEEDVDTQPVEAPTVDTPDDGFTSPSANPPSSQHCFTDPPPPSAYSTIRHRQINPGSGSPSNPKVGSGPAAKSSPRRKSGRLHPLPELASETTPNPSIKSMGDLRKMAIIQDARFKEAAKSPRPASPNPRARRLSVKPSLPSVEEAPAPAVKSQDAAADGAIEGSDPPRVLKRQTSGKTKRKLLAMDTAPPEQLVVPTKATNAAQTKPRVYSPVVKRKREKLTPDQSSDGDKSAVKPAAKVRRKSVQLSAPPPRTESGSPSSQTKRDPRETRTDAKNGRNHSDVCTPETPDIRQSTSTNETKQAAVGVSEQSKKLSNANTSRSTTKGASRSSRRKTITFGEAPSMCTADRSPRRAGGEAQDMFSEPRAKNGRNRSDVCIPDSPEIPQSASTTAQSKTLSNANTSRSKTKGASRSSRRKTMTTIGEATSVLPVCTAERSPRRGGGEAQDMFSEPQAHAKTPASSRRRSVPVGNWLADDKWGSSSEDEETNNTNNSNITVLPACTGRVHDDSKAEETAFDASNKMEGHSTAYSVLELPSYTANSTLLNLTRSRRSTLDFQPSQSKRKHSLAPKPSETTTKATTSSPKVSTSSTTKTNSAMVKTVADAKQKQGKVNGNRSSTPSSDSDSVCSSRTSSTKGDKRKWKKTEVSPSICLTDGSVLRTMVTTSLHTDEQDTVRGIVHKMGGFEVVHDVSSTTSHLVCGGNRRTLNVLRALARGCWIVSLKWVLMSLEKGSWLPEEEYELNKYFPCAKSYRTARFTAANIYTPTLFANEGIIFVAENSVPPQKELFSLITLCGGTTTPCARKAVISVGKPSKNNQRCVTEQWVLDCITSNKILPMRKYQML